MKALSECSLNSSYNAAHKLKAADSVEQVGSKH